MEYIILVISLAGIVFGADYLVAGSVSIARKFKVSDFVIGAAIVGIGTSIPELVVSFIGALNGNPDVAIGNVVGSNIFNVLGILGLTALLFPITITRSNMRFELPVCMAVSVIVTILVFNFFTGGSPVIGRWDGLVLLCCFGLFMWMSFYRDRKTIGTVETQPSHEESSPIWLSIVKIIGGMGVLIFSCEFFVDNAVAVARSLGVNDAFISLTLIACGTSLPELAAAIMAAKRKNTQLALGNVIGSNIFNITWILGLSSQVMPLNSSGITAVDYCVMISAAIVPFILGFKGRISRTSGALLFIGFIAYNYYLINNQIS